MIIETLFRVQKRSASCGIILACFEFAEFTRPFCALDIADNDANKLEYRLKKQKKEVAMAASIYKIIEIVGTSEKSWEDAAKTAVETAGKSLEDLRVAEVVKQDVTVEKGKVTSYRVRLNISFKYHGEK